MRVLFACDVTDKEQDVLDQVIEWAERLDAKVDLLYVEPYSASQASYLDPVFTRELQTALELGRKVHVEALEAVLERIPERLRGTVSVRSGDPARLIVDAAAEYDSVFVGTHGRRGVRRWFLGSVAEWVVRAATVPAIVMRRRDGNIEEAA